MKKVTVKALYLNVRQGKPSLSAPVAPPLAPGTIVNVEDQTYQGDAYDGIDTWYKDEGGNFLWSGDLSNGQNGVATLGASGQPLGGIVPTTTDAISSFTSGAAFPVTLVDWNSRIVKLPAAIRNGIGTGVRVSVLDSGVDKTHLDLAQNLVMLKDYTGAAAGENDIRGHGTEMASLIAGSPFLDGKGIMGVAPGASIYAGKVVYDMNDPGTFASLKAALDDTAAIKPDIVNMSFGRWVSSPIPADMQTAIIDSIAQQKQTIFFAATPESGSLNKPADLLQMFPGNQSVLIPVCALNQDQARAFINDLPVPIIILPVINASCCSCSRLRYYRNDNGSSISTALMSGITALLLGNNPGMSRDKDGVLNALLPYSSTIDEAFKDPDEEVHFIVKN